jgi:hypothetical protein
MPVPATPGTGTDRGDRVLEELTAAESLRLLASVPMGRVVFTDRALPAIRPVNHVLDAGEVIIRSSLGTGLTSAVDTSLDDVVVAYEADAIDPVDRVGWSVVVVGVARLETDPERIRRYERLLQPWVNRTMDRVIRIRPQIVTGYRLVAPVDEPR